MSDEGPDPVPSQAIAEHRVVVLAGREEVICRIRGRRVCREKVGEGDVGDGSRVAVACQGDGLGGGYFLSVGRQVEGGRRGSVTSGQRRLVLTGEGEIGHGGNLYAFLTVKGPRGSVLE